MRTPPPARRTSVGGRWVPSRPIGDCPQRGGIVTVVPCMRVGLLVEDLDEAIANFADQLGVPFSESLAADNDSF
jgi:hypothetical protein